MKSNINTHSVICLVVTAIVYFVLCLSGHVANAESQGWTGVDEELDVRIVPTNEGAAPTWAELNASIAAVQDELRAIEQAEEELQETVVSTLIGQPEFVLDLSMVDNGTFDCGMGMKPLAEVVLATPERVRYEPAQPKEYTIRELKAICKANKGVVKGYSNMTKSELLESLRSKGLLQ